MGARAFFPTDASKSGHAAKAALPPRRYIKLVEVCDDSGGKYQVLDAEDFALLLEKGAHHGIVNAPQEGGSYKNQATVTHDGKSLTFEILTEEPLP